MFSAVLALSAAALTIWTVSGSTHRSCVQGRVTCPSHPSHANFMPVRTIDEDWGTDDLIKNGTTDRRGHFHLCGNASDPVGTPDVYIQLYTQCGKDPKKDCPRRIKIKVDDKWFEKTYDLGVFNMEPKTKNEDYTCL